MEAPTRAATGKQPGIDRDHGFFEGSHEEHGAEYPQLESLNAEGAGAAEDVLLLNDFSLRPLRPLR
jgi:hypothetical protein